MPDSGTGITRSASTGASFANCWPIFPRTAWMLCPAIVVSGLARYTYSKMQPLGSAVAHISERIPSSLIAKNSPGSTSRTNAAPTISSAADSDATTQPRSNFPSTSGRTPCRSRAAYKVFSSIKTSENAPSNLGSTARALASTLFSSCNPMSAVMISVSVVAPRPFLVGSSSSF